MIIATPNGKFFSEASREPYKWYFWEITEEMAIHYCKESQDEIIYRPLTLREWFRTVYLKVIK